MCDRADPLSRFRAPVEEWFSETFSGPTEAQVRGWGAILEGRSTLLLAPTGSGKTLAAFLCAIDRLMFAAEPPEPSTRCRVLYISPLKALAVDIERNLRSPLEGIAHTAARCGVETSLPEVFLRTGDTPARERARMVRRPPDILITTPESLYLLLTSKASSVLHSVETVIIDEIHALAGGKRGAHLMVSLERLEALRARRGARALQRIGLSATQRPLDEIARFLGGGHVDSSGDWQPRQVTVVDAGRRKEIDLSIQMPVEVESASSSSTAEATKRPSMWEAIHLRLVELIREHHTTMVFVNSRRLAERMAESLNALAAEEIALAHHGSVAREQRLEIEDRLKRGDIPAIVATSSMELGIDMGAVDLVVQIETPPSVASGLQRIGRANHAVGEVPRGIVFPKFRGELLACAALTRAMLDGDVESTRYPRSPLDVLAQQIVAMVSMRPWDVDELFDISRQAAPFAELPRSSFEGLLDLLSGRYPSDEFRDLRARITWDRIGGTVKARQGSQRLAIANAGTIPDRGLYGVFLLGDDGTSGKRVGELDEEMVFETEVGEVFLLGASSWRVHEITHDRVLVTAAAGEPGKMPFWHGERVGRAMDFGRAIGRLGREIIAAPREQALERLRGEHSLDSAAAENLLCYLEEQRQATKVLPSDRDIVIESSIDELGDWRVCVLSPFGGAVHAPWSQAVVGRLQSELGQKVESLWRDDGMMFRLPETGECPPYELLIPDSDSVESLVVEHLASTSLFAARFRENAARALLLPRRRPGTRSPLWLQRKRSADLLAVASRYTAFPILLETYRECLRDVFDLPGLVEILECIRSREVRVHRIETRRPSPFASSILFHFVGTFLYDDDAPLAERRARTLCIDQEQLRELLGEEELRELLDADSIEEYERVLQHLVEGRRARHADGVHDLLLSLGDLSTAEILERSVEGLEVEAALESLEEERRVVPVCVAGESRWIAAEDAASYRDGLGIPLPPGLPAAFLEESADALRGLCARWARTHGPFPPGSLVARLGVAKDSVRSVLRTLEDAGRLVSGAFLRHGDSVEWCDVEVLRMIKRRSLAVLRSAVEPAEPEVFARMLCDWQGLRRRRRGVEGLLEVVQDLEACPLLVSTFEREVLARRVEDYDPAWLDALLASGEIVWQGIEAVGSSDGRVAFYLRERHSLLARPGRRAEGELVGDLRARLAEGGATFFSQLVADTGAFRGDIGAALIDLVWSGEVTNDTFRPLRSLGRARSTTARRSARSRAGSTRRPLLGPPGTEGRWSLLPELAERDAAFETRRRHALTETLLARYGVLTREAVLAEGVDGGFASIYPILSALEDGGRIRRGYFVAGLGATQFATGGADDRLRDLRAMPPEETAQEPAMVLAATDPANPYGSILPWPQHSSARIERRGGARVVLGGGRLLAWIGRSERDLLTFLPSGDPDRSRQAKALAAALADHVRESGRRAFLLRSIDGRPALASSLRGALEGAGFRAGPQGFLARPQDLHAAGSPGSGGDGGYEPDPYDLEND